MKTIFNYWCGAINYARVKDRYIMYLLISSDSLINVAKVDPKNIYCTIEKQLHSSKYFSALKKTGVNILDAPVYKNYSKQYCYSEIIKSNPDIDFLAQIDCDTIITDPDILNKIQSLDCGINVDWSGGKNYGIDDLNNSHSIFDLISSRDGQKHPTNNMASILNTKDSDEEKAGCPIRYASFRDFLLDQYDVDLNDLIEYSKNVGAIHGFFYVLRPKLLPKDFFKFLRFFNFFFQDDEVSLSFAKHYFDLKFGDRSNIKPNIMNQAKNISDFKKLKGVIHFPNKDDEIRGHMEIMANKIINKYGQLH